MESNPIELSRLCAGLQLPLPVCRKRTALPLADRDPDAVDDHNFYCALLCSTHSTTCCCIAVWTVESNDFLRPICQNRLAYQEGISRHTDFSLEFPSAVIFFTFLGTVPIPVQLGKIASFSLQLGKIAPLDLYENKDWKCQAPIP